MLRQRSLTHHFMEFLSFLLITHCVVGLVALVLVLISLEFTNHLLDGAMRSRPLHRRQSTRRRRSLQHWHGSGTQVLVPRLDVMLKILRNKHIGSKPFAAIHNNNHDFVTCKVSTFLSNSSKPLQNFIETWQKNILLSLFLEL